MKKTILTVLQVLVTLGILAYLFRDADQRNKMAEAIANASRTWIFLGLVCYGVVEILAAVRLQILLRVQGVHVGWWRLVSLVMIGILFNQFMPGGVGGDVVKIFYLLKEASGKKAQALLAVLMDRLVGMLSLMSLAAVLIGVRYSWLTQGTPPMEFSAWHPGSIVSWLARVPVTTQLAYLSIGIFMAAAIGVATSFIITGFHLVHKIPKRFPAHDKLVELSVAYNLYARAWKPSLLAFVISWGIHLGSFGVFYAAGRALSVGVSMLDMFAIMPIINTVSSMPISVGGAGVREGMFQQFLNKLCGVPIPDATVVSLTGAAIMLAWGLVGGVVYLFYRPSEHAKLSEIQHEVKELEHEIAESEPGDGTR